MCLLRLGSARIIQLSKQTKGNDMTSKNVALAVRELQTTLKSFMPPSQRHVLIQALDGEEAEGIAETVLRVCNVINTMPETYETDGEGEEAWAHLHYFLGGIDAWVTEKDKGNGSDDQRQEQAFGKVCLTGNKEDADLGYISIAELIENGVELDLYWNSKKLKEI